ncbi:hypothetical protein LCGC14_3080310, partial [marine sediment metagenome]
PRVESVDLTRLMAETVRLLKFQLRGRDIHLEADVRGVPPVRMDPNRCKQLFLNLLLNAIEASDRGGTVQVTGAEAPESAVVRIEDAGAGFPEAVLAEQAEEFFSAKTTGAGLRGYIARFLVRDAVDRIDHSNLRVISNLARLRKYGIAALILVLIFGGTTLMARSFMTDRGRRVIAPWISIAQKKHEDEQLRIKQLLLEQERDRPISFDVTPGNMPVLRGSSVNVAVKPSCGS